MVAGIAGDRDGIHFRRGIAETIGGMTIGEIETGEIGTGTIDGGPLAMPSVAGTAGTTIVAGATPLTGGLLVGIGKTIRRLRRFFVRTGLPALTLKPNLCNLCNLRIVHRI